MKEIGLPFMALMVRAVLAGIKTKTRRVVKNQPEADETIIVGTYRPTVIDRHGNEQPGPEVFGAYSANGEWAARCPYGQPGDRLWVRENWRTVEASDNTPPRDLTAAHRIWFEADGPHQPGFGKFRPGMFMCRWMSRILLEVVSVRVERLQDISEEDAIAEGVVLDPTSPPGPLWRMALGSGNWHNTARGAYRELWESINGHGSWDPNHWVWVVEFRRIAA